MSNEQVMIPIFYHEIRAYEALKPYEFCIHKRWKQSHLCGETIYYIDNGF